VNKFTDLFEYGIAPSCFGESKGQKSWAIMKKLLKKSCATFKFYKGYMVIENA